MYVGICVGVYACGSVGMHVCVCMCVWECVHACVHACVYACVCAAYVPIFKGDVVH